MVEEDDKPGWGRGGTKKRRAYTRAGEDRDYKDKYAHVTLAKEDYKPEEGEKVGLGRCESSPRTTRKGIIGEEIMEGRVVKQGKDFKGISKSFFEKPKVTHRRRGEVRGMKGRQGKISRVCWEVGAERKKGGN